MPGGRPYALNAEYVAHWGNPNNRVKHIEKRFEKTGFAIYYKLRELLTTTDNHYLNFSNKHELLYFATDCWCTVEEVNQVLDVLAELEEIDPELWQKKIVCSEPFLHDISVAYKRRANQCPSINTIRAKFQLPAKYVEEYQEPKAKAPTLEQVLEFATDNHSSEKYLKRKATRFFNHYSAKGWKIGENPVEDWTKILANWLEKDREKEQQEQQQKPKTNGQHQSTSKASNETGARKDFAK